MPRESWIRWKVSRIEFTTPSGKRIPVEVRRRKGTRHLRLRYSVRNQIVVSLPWHSSEKTCRNFIEQNRKWLERQIDAAPRLVGIEEWLQRSPRLSLCGRSLPVSIQQAKGARGRYEIDPDATGMTFYLPAGAGESVLYDLVRQFAKKALARRTSEIAERLGLQYGRLTVRDQSSRWGSCSSKRTISLNWRLVLLPPYLQDYIIYHELAHLSEMNHSSKFWKLLDRYDPDRVTHEAELDQQTHQYMRVRAPA